MVSVARLLCMAVALTVALVHPAAAQSFLSKLIGGNSEIVSVSPSMSVSLLRALTDVPVSETTVPKSATAVGLSLTAETSMRKEAATIAVLGSSDFVPDTAAPAESKRGLPDSLVNRIVENLANSKRFVPVERQALRRVVNEQRLGKEIKKTYMDRALDKAIDSMGSFDLGALTVGVTTLAASQNDLMKDLKDLGSAVKADYLVFGLLEKMEASSQVTEVPYSTQGRTQTLNAVDARLRFRIIETETGRVIGATSLRHRVEEAAFTGIKSNSDQFSATDEVARQASTKILDAIYPAKVRGLQPLVITRGANEGAQVGDRYTIRRAGKEITDSDGTVLGQVLTDVGVVEIVEPQATFSVVNLVSGNPPQKDDLAVLAETGVDSAQSSPKSAPPIGAAAQAQRPGQIPRVAVGVIKQGTTAGAQEEAAMTLLTDTLISRLVQTKRFKVADRHEVDQLLGEQTLEALANNKALPNAVGIIQAVDYLAIGNVTVFETGQEQVSLPGSSRQLRPNTVGYVEGNLRIVDMRTSDIIGSRKISVQIDLDDQNTASRIGDRLADAYAEQAVAILMQALYPIKVAAVGPDGTVYVNRGSDGGLAVGETLKAYRKGEPIRDPDTGVALGFSETLTAEVSISEVEDAGSKGSIVKGDGLAVGDILKRGSDAKLAGQRTSALPQRSGATIGAAPAEGSALGKFTLVVSQMEVSGVSGTSLASAELIERAGSRFASGLHKTSRFQIMERKGIDTLIDEKSFEAATRSGKIKDRLRELEGADYVVMSRIDNFRLTKTTKPIPYTDRIQVNYTGFAEGTLRIADVHSGKVVSGETFKIQPRWGKVESDEVAISNLVQAVVDDMVERVVNGLYPIKLLGVAAGGQVYLNRGSDGGVKIGEIYDLMRPGDDLKDPDTGVSFGASENKVGEVQIVSTEAARSVAKVLSGDHPVKGDIARKRQNIADTGAGAGAATSAPQPTYKPNW